MIVPDDTHLCGLQYRESGYKLNRSLSLSSFQHSRKPRRNALNISNSNEKAVRGRCVELHPYIYDECNRLAQSVQSAIVEQPLIKLTPARAVSRNYP